MSDIQDLLREVLASSLQGAGGQSESKPAQSNGHSNGGGSHTGRALIAGAGAAALAPMAAKGLGKLAREGGIESVKHLTTSPGKIAKAVGSNIGSDLGDTVKDKVDEAGGAGGILSGAVKDMLPFGGDDDGGGGGGEKGGGLGVGRGRRMPVQQSIDIAAPVETVYNQWTQYEDWPKFMHRVVRASQEDETSVTLSVKIWGRTREFKAGIDTQRPDERVKWHVDQGMTHCGVVSFHELGPNLTRVLLSIDVEPSGMIEKLARGARYVKRAARGDLHRFKAYIEMAEHETGAWRGVIEDGEVVEDHDPDYDKDREYSDPDEILQTESDDDDEDEQDDDEEEEVEDEQPRSRGRQSSSNGRQGSTRAAASRSSGSSRSRSSGSSSGSSRSSGSRSSGSSGGSSRSSGSRSSGSSGSSRSSGSRSSGSSTRSGGSGSGSTRAKSGSSGGSKSGGSKSGGRSSGSSSSSRSGGSGSRRSSGGSSGGSRRSRDAKS